LYWTLLQRAATLQPMQNTPRSLPLHLTTWALALCCTLLGSWAYAGGHEAVSADTAAQALAQGATVVDVRSASAYAQGHLPGAQRLPSDAARFTSAQLGQAVSIAGIDLSRTVLVVGELGDANAQALWQTLSGYATGRVLWLVGGTTEWQMTGRALSTDTIAAKAVPQHLVRLHAAPEQARMAGHSVRNATSFNAAASQISLLN
jgi:3-mercaptopyruvate sulfurtransferase SseA